ncbi:hypothetical protein [Microbispora sp. ATCC PTA-5024]|uniref:hypothetical protein n=1 Tax=Microbispora sp. ATCC PTA-5024 TaxID=316330 RepID=UPI0003DD99B5|nr:hypothetical protein [Microbispora sp. ATCC PTA-5024]ETK36131.1 hypothetical protein MPTA5024_10930 [Microbispora sp. ATCC PTA-5024]
MGFMDGPPLATPANLDAYTGQSVPAAQAELALRLASGMVRRWTGQQISLVKDDTVTLAGGRRVLYLPQRPVVVDADHPLTVTELGGVGYPNLLAVDNVTFTRLADELTRYCGWWTDRVQVTYSHGYASIPDDIVGVVLDVAARSMTNTMGLRTVTIDDYTRTYANETLGTTLTQQNRDALAAYRRPARSAVLS